MPKLTTSSVLVSRTEKTRITVRHPPEWTAAQVQEAVLAAAEDLDEQMGDPDDVTFRVKRVDIKGTACDIDEWEAPDLSSYEDDGDEDDEDEDDEDNDEDGV